MNPTINDLLAIPEANRREAYKAMRSDLENDWIHVSPSALRNRYKSAQKREDAGKTAMAAQDFDLIDNDVSNYARKRHIKHLLAVLAGNYDTVLLAPNFEYTVHYSHHQDWNDEANFIAAHRLSELKG